MRDVAQVESSDQPARSNPSPADRPPQSGVVIRHQVVPPVDTVQVYARRRFPARREPRLGPACVRPPDHVALPFKILDGELTARPARQVFGYEAVTNAWSPAEPAAIQQLMPAAPAIPS